MSYARGDLARRAALADNLAVPEPWSSNDDPRVFAAIRDLRNEFRQLGITDEDGKGRLPDFLLDYEHLPPIKPTTLDRAHTRNSAATRWDRNGNLVEDSSDTLRLQRDPATGDVLGLLYEPQRTQLLSAATDPSVLNDNDGVVVSPSTGNAKGQTYTLLQDDGTTGAHFIGENYGIQGDGTPVSSSIICKNDNGVPWVGVGASYGGDHQNTKYAWYKTDGSSTTQDSLTYLTFIDVSIDDLGGGWYRFNLTAKPDAGHEIDRTNFLLAKNSGDRTYSGDSSALRVLHTQAEVSREVTTPILTGNATRGADEVDYRFSFPDKETGVAYSIEQQSGGFVFAGDNIIFGTTSDITNRDHGVLFDGGGDSLSGLNADSTDGYKTIARNSKDTASDGTPPQSDTIDRFSVDLFDGGKTNTRRFIVRQIAIHTQPHTQAQKSALADQYLTQG